MLPFRRPAVVRLEQDSRIFTIMSVISHWRVLLSQTGVRGGVRVVPQRGSERRY